MFERNLNWYKTKLKKFIPFKFFIIVISVFSAIGIIYGGVKGIKSIYDYIFTNKMYYKTISKLNTGINSKYVDQMLGFPIIVRRIDYVVEDIIEDESGDIEIIRNENLAKYIEKAYSAKNFFVYTRV